MSLQEEGQRGLQTTILCQQVLKAAEFGEVGTQAEKKKITFSHVSSAELELPMLLVTGIKKKKKKVKIKMCNGQQSEVSTALQDNNNNIH